MATLTKAESEADHDTGEPKAGINFGNLAFGLPAVLIITIMPLTYSITNGIGAGFIAYTLIRVVQGKAREVSWMMYGAGIGFIIYFAFPLIRYVFNIAETSPAAGWARRPPRNVSQISTSTGSAAVGMVCCPPMTASTSLRASASSAL
jgi:hypothetical protein